MTAKVDQPPSPDVEEIGLLGLAIFMAQKVEFALYGIASHMAHLPSAQSDKRFRSLTPEKFLRGDPRALKATLGQLVEQFGEAFFIKSNDLVGFYEDRNLIAHDFFRSFHLHIKGTTSRENPKEFLRDFISRAERWLSIIAGLLTELRLAAARGEGRESEVSLTVADRANMAAYHEHAVRHLGSKLLSTTTK